MDDKAVDLLATLVQSNSDQLASVNEAVRVSIERDRDRMAKAFATLYDSLQNIPEMIRTSYIDSLLYNWGLHRDQAARFLNESEE